MKQPLASAAFGVALLIAGVATAQSYAPQSYAPPAFPIAPAPPEMFPTWSPYGGEQSSTARHNIAATPDCGAANSQHGIPSMITGTCP
jgi:hypothetical protein